MCNERERMIDYLYDEGSADARRASAAHLATCPECQDELRSLQAVRNDLASWNVPVRESVWTSFAPTQMQPWWRQVPTWAMAAAAALLLAVGATSGFIARAAWMPAPVASAPAPTIVDAFSIEQNVLGKVRADLAAHQVPAALVAPQNVSTSAGRSDAEFMKQVQALIADSAQRQTHAWQVQLSGVQADMEARHQAELQSLQQRLDFTNNAMVSLNRRVPSPPAVADVKDKKDKKEH